MGSEIDLSDEEPENALFPIFVSFDPDSNVNEERYLRPDSAPSEMAVSDAGSERDDKQLHPDSAQESINSRFDTDSKANEFRP
jgi:hypothetical protein